MPAFPVVPGYSAAGIVENPGPDSIWEPGQRVFFSDAPCANFAVSWGAHQRHVVVPDRALTEVPPGVDLGMASSAKLVAIAEHGQRIAAVRSGERVAVLGLGPIGFFTALCARARGAIVAVSDLRPARRELAEELGLAILPSEQPSSSEGFDVVVDATGAAPALPIAVSLLREKPWDDLEHPTARLLVQGSYANPPALPYDELFLKEPQILIPRDNQRRDVEAALDMMARGTLPVDRILHDFGSPGRAAEVYQTLAGGEWITGYFSWD
jgi:2-desacetyl-2-hydroxyethyl bacteriochlorophyllide A dehydrogenase